MHAEDNINKIKKLITVDSFGGGLIIFCKMYIVCCS